jgi:hypothetical protein
MRIIKRGTIFDATSAPPPARFCTFTSLNCLTDGRLVAAFRVGSSKDSPDEDVYILTSDDEGTTWQQRCTGFGDVPPGGGGRIRSIGLIGLPAGKLMASIIAVDRSDPTLPLANPETQGILPTIVFVTESKDSGQSWSTPRPVDLHPHTGNAITGDLLQLKDGTLVLPYEAWKGYHDASAGEHHAALRFSADGGQSWSGPAIVAHDPTGRLLFWDQRLTVSPDDGRLFAIFWTHDREAQEDVFMHTAWGSADGYTWSIPRPLLAGQIGAPLALPGGRLFAAYVHRHDPPSLRALLSDDFGESWRVDEQLIFYEKRRGGGEAGMDGPRDFGDYWADMSIWTFGHPAPARLPNGDVIVAYYAGNEEAMGIQWVRIALDEAKRG